MLWIGMKQHKKGAKLNSKQVFNVCYVQVLCSVNYGRRRMGEENVSGGHVLDFYFELSSCDDPSYQFLQTMSYIMT